MTTTVHAACLSVCAHEHVVSFSLHAYPPPHTTPPTLDLSSLATTALVSTAMAWLISSVSLMVGRAEEMFWRLGGRMITGTTPTNRQAWKATMRSTAGGGAGVGQQDKVW